MCTGSVVMATEPGGCTDVVQCLSIFTIVNVTRRESLFLVVMQSMYLSTVSITVEADAFYFPTMFYI